jgi:RNA polymerase sigma factor (sigma-70 family)
MMNPETTYLQNLASIERIAAFVARRGHLNADDTTEFVQIVRVRLFEDDYAIIRKFEGRSSFPTYLTTVIIRLFHQWRVEQWGKWRPSAEAKRLGEKAITLERLITRDGFTFQEAVRTLTTRAGAVYTVAELEMLYVRLPLRNPRPVLVSEEVSPDAVAVNGDADERIETSDRERTARTAAAAIEGELASLDAEDRLILQMRFTHNRKVPDIARVLQIDQKKIYKRLDKLFAILRRALEKAGVRKADVDQLLDRGDHEIRLDLMNYGESVPFSPSNGMDGKESHGGDGVPR